MRTDGERLVRAGARLAHDEKGQGTGCLGSSPAAPRFGDVASNPPSPPLRRSKRAQTSPARIRFDQRLG